MSTLDELLSELNLVLVALDAADDATRPGLEQRRDAIREKLRTVDLDAQRPTSELQEEHARLAARLHAAKGERVKKVRTKYLGATQTVGGGVVPSEINRMLDEANRVEELEERFERLTHLLEERGAL